MSSFFVYTPSTFAFVSIYAKKKKKKKKKLNKISAHLRKQTQKTQTLQKHLLLWMYLSVVMKMA
jgi:hypothetical protein